MKMHLYRHHLENAAYKRVYFIIPVQQRKSKSSWISNTKVCPMGISVHLGQQENDAGQASVAEVWVPLSLPGTVYKAIGEEHFHWTYRKDKDLGCKEISKLLFCLSLLV